MFGFVPHISHNFNCNAGNGIGFVITCRAKILTNGIVIVVNVIVVAVCTLGLSLSLSLQFFFVCLVSSLIFQLSFLVQHDVIVFESLYETESSG